MEYDKEFDKFWESSYKGSKELKKIAYSVWEAAKAPKPEQNTIDLEGGEWYLDTISTTVVNFHSSKGSRLAGRERKTEEYAKKAAEHMRKRDRLAAFVYEHCGFEGEFIEGGENYYIFLDIDEEYDYTKEYEYPDICKQYMPESTARWLCEKMNSGEIVL